VPLLAGRYHIAGFPLSAAYPQLLVRARLGLWLPASTSLLRRAAAGREDAAVPSDRSSDADLQLNLATRLLRVRLYRSSTPATVSLQALRSCQQLPAARYAKQWATA
jgi:hypothetical protein